PGEDGVTVLEEAVVAAGGPDEAESAQRPRVRRRIMRTLAMAWLAVIVLLALFVPLLPTPDPTKSVGLIAGHPFGRFLLGTDQIGRDIFARIAYGARLSSEVVFVSTGIAFVVGVALGIVAGYFRGKLDLIIAGIRSEERRVGK